MKPEESCEWWWVDYLENEMTPQLAIDLRFLLEHSAEDRHAYESFRLLRAWVKASDPVEQIPIEATAKSIRSKVMNAISESARNYTLNPATKDLSV